jgi:aromatic-L-amino-acid decarboxylase
MTHQEILQIEESLDPKDWEALRALGHQMVDEMLEKLREIRQEPVWKPLDEPLKQALRAPLPRQGEGAEQAYADFVQFVRANPMGNIHPRFWGWVIGGGTPLGALAEMLAAGLNPNMGGGEHAANYVEQQVLAWCKEMLDYPMEASGLLVSGGSMANFVGLAVARNARAGYDIRREGLAAAPQRLVLYASSEAHSSVQKAVELLGLGSSALRLVKVNGDFQIDVQVLKTLITADRQAGYHPFCVVGTCGTTNTGAIDDLPALAKICRQEGLWLHVDGAFGAIAALDPELRPLTAGMEQADSLAFDLHKWLSVPHEAGCVLVRDEAAHRGTFTLTPEYLTKMKRGVAAGAPWFSDYGLELSRGFKALKVWMMFKADGIDKYAQMVAKNVAQARYLAARVDAESELERLAPVSLNIVCFRYVAPGMDEEALNALNQELLLRLHESGTAVPSYTRLHGRYALRVANVNHRSRQEDFDILVEAVLKLGRALVKEG